MLSFSLVYFKLLVSIVPVRQLLNLFSETKLILVILFYLDDPSFGLLRGFQKFLIQHF